MINPASLTSCGTVPHDVRHGAAGTTRAAAPIMDPPLEKNVQALQPTLSGLPTVGTLALSAHRSIGYDRSVRSII